MNKVDGINAHKPFKTDIIIIIIIIIITIIIIISFMQGIYTYIPETNYVPREYSVAAILLLIFMVFLPLVPVLNLLYFYISTFRSMCAVPNMAVFWNSFTSCFPGMLLTYFLSYFEIVPVAPSITGITFVFTFHMRCTIIIIIIIIIAFNFFQRSGPLSDRHRSCRGFAAEKNLSNLPEIEKRGEIM